MQRSPVTAVVIVFGALLLVMVGALLYGETDEIGWTVYLMVSIVISAVAVLAFMRRRERQAMGMVADYRYNNAPQAGMQEPLMLRLCVRYTEEIIREAQTFLSLTGGLRYTWILNLAMSACLIVGGIVTRAWFVVLMGLFVVALYPIAWWNARRSARSRWNVGAMEFFFHLSHFRARFQGESRNTEETVAFGALKEVIESRDAFFLVTAARTAYLIPKAEMPPDMQAWLRDYLRKRFPAAYRNL